MEREGKRSVSDMKKQQGPKRSPYGVIVVQTKSLWRYRKCQLVASKEGLWLLLGNLGDIRKISWLQVHTNTWRWLSVYPIAHLLNVFSIDGVNAGSFYELRVSWTILQGRKWTQSYQVPSHHMWPRWSLSHKLCNAGREFAEAENAFAISILI